MTLATFPFKMLDLPKYLHIPRISKLIIASMGGIGQLSNVNKTEKHFQC